MNKDLERKYKIIMKDAGFSDPGFGRIYRNSAKLIAYPFLKTGLTPNHITIIGFLLGLVSCILFLAGTYPLNILAVLIIQMRIVFDFLDGMIARAKNMCSGYGEWLDRILDRLLDPIMFFCIAFALYSSTKNPMVWVYGFLAVVGTMLNASLLPITKINYPEIDRNIKKRVGQENILQYFVFSRVNLYLALSFFVVINRLFLFLPAIALYSSLFYFASLLYLSRKLKKMDSIVQVNDRMKKSKRF